MYIYYNIHVYIIHKLFGIGVLLFFYSSLEYDPRFYGLYFHDDTMVPSDVSMWDYLDDVAPSYQDSLVMHMLHKPIQVSFDKTPEE